MVDKPRTPNDLRFDTVAALWAAREKAVTECQSVPDLMDALDDLPTTQDLESAFWATLRKLRSGASY